MEIENLTTGTRIRPRGNFVHHRYEFPDGQVLDIEAVDGRWYFDGEPAKETWPIPLRRDFVCGERTFRVKPEDDTLFYAVPDGDPGWVVATMGMHIFLGAPGSGPD